MAIDTTTKAGRLRTKVSRQTVQIDPTSAEDVAIGSSHTESNQINADKLMFWSDVEFYMNIGDASVEATNANPFFPANQMFVIDFTSGEYISTLYNGSDTGTLHLIGVY